MMDKYELRELRRNYRYIKMELEQLNNERERLYTMATSCTRRPNAAPSYGGSHDPYPVIIDKLDAISAKAHIKFNAMVDMRVRFEQAIQELSERERILMRAYYIEGRRWDQVTDMMFVSLRNVHNIHSKALQKLKVCIVLH